MGNDTKYFLLWGWVTFIACVGQFVLKNVFDYNRHYLVWLLVIPGIITSVLFGINEEKSRKVKTYLDDSMKYLWMGMGISYFVLIIILNKLGWGINIFPFFMLLYGLGTFVSGKFLQFPPMVIGGSIAWALAIIAVFFSYDYQMLFGAAAILFSYIIPSYMLRNKNNSSPIN